MFGLDGNLFNKSSDQNNNSTQTGTDSGDPRRNNSQQIISSLVKRNQLTPTQENPTHQFNHHSINLLSPVSTPTAKKTNNLGKGQTSHQDSTLELPQQFLTHPDSAADCLPSQQPSHSMLIQEQKTTGHIDTDAASTQGIRNYYNSPNVLVYEGPLLILKNSTMQILPFDRNLLLDSELLCFFQNLIDSPLKADFKNLVQKKIWEVLVYSLLIPNTSTKFLQACSSCLYFKPLSEQMDVYRNINDLCKLYNFQYFQPAIRDNFEKVIADCTNKVKFLSDRLVENEINFAFVENKLFLVGPFEAVGESQLDIPLMNLKRTIQFICSSKKFPEKEHQLILNNEHLYAKFPKGNLYIPYILAYRGGVKAYLAYFNDHDPEKIFLEVKKLIDSASLLKEYFSGAIFCKSLRQLEVSSVLQYLETQINPKGFFREKLSNHIQVFFLEKKLFITGLKVEGKQIAAGTDLDFNAYSWFLKFKNNQESTTKEIITMIERKQYHLLAILLSLPGTFKIILQAIREYNNTKGIAEGKYFYQSLQKNLEKFYIYMKNSRHGDLKKIFYVNHLKLCAELGLEPTFHLITFNQNSYDLIINEEKSKLIRPTLTLIHHYNTHHSIPSDYVPLSFRDYFISFNLSKDFYLPSIFFEASAKLYFTFLRSVIGNNPKGLKFLRHLNSLIFCFQNHVPNMSSLPILHRIQQSVIAGKTINLQEIEEIFNQLLVSHLTSQIAMHNAIKTLEPLPVALLSQVSAKEPIKPPQESLPEAELPQEISTFVQTLDARDKQLFYHAYMNFYTILREELKIGNVAIGLRAILENENGFFGFTEIKNNALFKFFERIFRNFREKNPEVLPTYITQIKYDFLQFFVFLTDNYADFGHKELLLRNMMVKNEICNSKLLLPRDEIKIVLETFFKAKISEYKHHIKSSILQPSLKVPKQEIPCCFVYYNSHNAPILKIYNACFDERGILRSLFSGDQNGKQLISSMLHKDINPEQVLSYQDLDLLKKHLTQNDGQKEMQFILFEQKQLHLDQTRDTSRKRKPAGEPPRKRRKGNTQPIATKTIIVEEDAFLLGETDSGYTMPAKRKKNYSLTLPQPPNSDVPVSNNFWQKFLFHSAKAFKVKPNLSRQYQIIQHHYLGDYLIYLR